MKTIEDINKKFDKKFGKLNDGCEPGDDCSNGNMAGCDDCEENQRIREKHREFLIQEITELLESLKRSYKKLDDIKHQDTDYWEGVMYRDKRLRDDINKILNKWTQKK